MVVLCSLLGSPVNSAIIYRNTETVLHANNDTWDIDADGTSETSLSVVFGEIVVDRNNIDFIRPNPLNAIAGNIATGLPLQALPRNFSIRATLGNYAWAEGIRNLLGTTSISQEEMGGVSDDTSSYIGFRFDGDRATSGRQNLFGWARVTSGTSTLITIHEWAYEDVLEEAIAVGQTIIPEPTSASLGLLALGAVGLRRFRKQRVSA